MRYISVCSGIEAATAAWHPLGWQPLCFAEIDPAPRAILSHHYPDVPLVGDFTQIKGDEYGPVDLLVGGTPCQSFSVAGLRGGLADERGNLALEFLRLADRARPRWVVWENVPGVLSSSGGRDFGAFLGGLGQLGYGFAYRVLDAQHFGVPQRRRRVFVVGYLGDWRRAAAVLFERHSLSGHPAPRRETRQVAPTIPSRSSAGGGLGTDFDCDGGLIQEAFGGGRTSGSTDVAACLVAKGHKCDFEVETFNAHSLRGEGFDASEDGTGRGTPLVPVAAIQERAVSENPDAGPDGAGYRTDGQAYTLEARTVPQAIAFNARQDPTHGLVADLLGSKDTGHGVMLPVPFDTTQITSAANHSKPKAGDPCHPLAAGAHAPAVAFGWQNSPLQGLSDSETTVPTLDKSKVPAVVSSVETMYGVSYADAAQTYPDEALRALREAVGEKAYTEWCAGILTAFRTPEVLRSAVHGSGFRRPSDKRNELGDDALPRQEDGRGGAVLALWQAGSDGRSPRGWQPPEQLAGELVAHLSKLPHQRASAQRFLLGLWRASEGLGLLREALSALQEAWRPAHGENQPARLNSAVRRLTPEECEKLQGFSPGYTLVPYRGRMMADGPRYKALGNSMAVPVMRWIGERIAQVEAISKSERRAA